MIVTLLRRDSAIRTLSGRALAVTLFSAMFLLNVMILQATHARAEFEAADGALFVLPSQPGTAAFAIHLTIAWAILIVFFLLSRIQQRVGPLDLSLPIPARVLWRTHIIGQILAGAILLAMVGILVGLANWGLSVSRIHARFLEWPAAVTHIAHLLAGLSLVTALVSSFHLELSRLPITRRVMLALAGAFLGTLAIMLVLSPGGPATASVTLILAAFVARRAQARLPDSFVMAPLDTVADAAVAPSPLPGMTRPATIEDTAKTTHAWRDAPSSPWSEGLLLVRTIWRSLYGHVLGFLLLGIVMLYAFFLGGGALSIGEESADTGAVWIPITWYLLLAFQSKFMKKLYLLDALPISRRALFAAFALPGILALVAGYGGGRAVLSHRLASSPAIVMNTDEGFPELRVTLEFFRVAWDGTPPPVTSPWGETHEAKTIPIVGSGGPVLYKPYTTPEGSSARFIALQLSRAIHDIYGRSLSVDQVYERYLVNGSEPVSMRADGVPLTEDLERWSPHTAGQTFPVIMVLVLVPWLLMLAAIMRIYRGGISLTRQKILVISVMGAALIIQTGIIGAAVLDRLDLHTVTAVIKSTGHQLALALPGGTITLWILAAIPILAAYRLAEWRFHRVEAMPQKKGCWSWT